MRRLARGACAGLVALFVASHGVLADPAPGFVEEWTGTGLAGWGGGATYSNPGTGGFLGDGDGFLLMSTPSAGRLAGFSTSADYSGNWQAAGIVRIRLRLNDVNADDSLEIHVMIVSGADLWIFDPGFRPPERSWGEFEVDLASAASFTHVAGTGTFAQALQSVDRIQIRHDAPPFQQPADIIQADFGIDHLELLDPATPAILSTWGRIKALYR